MAKSQFFDAFPQRFYLILFIIERKKTMSKKYVYLFSEGNANMRELLGGKGANLA